MSDKRISLSDIAAAEKLLGIEYSQDERELMADNLEDLIAAAQAQRSVIFPNTLPPAKTFDPPLSTTVLPASQIPI
jgi:aldehyde:ferredoxin oxidoreductase